MPRPQYSQIQNKIILDGRLAIRIIFKREAMDYNFEDLEKIMKEKETKDVSKRHDDRDRYDDRRDRDRDRDREPRDKDRDARDRDRDRGRDRDRDDTKERHRDKRSSRSQSHERKKDKKDKKSRVSPSEKQREHSASRSRDRKRKKLDSREKSDKSSSQRRDHRQKKDAPVSTKPQTERDPYYKERRQIEKVIAVDPKRAQEMERQLQKRIIMDKKNKEVQIMTEKFKEAKKQLEEAHREDLTVLVHSLPLKAKEKDIWQFFIKQGCGKVADIRIIKDPKSNKSKGVAYVQFFTSESVQKALLQSDKPFECNGRVFQGFKVMHSQAEKNRAAAAARQMRMRRPQDPFESTEANLRKSMKVVVGGLEDRLADIQQDRLKELFGPFGHIDYVDIHRDPLTGRCKGFAFIQYTKVEDAKVAVAKMNGIKINGQPIKVTTVSVTQRGDPNSISNDDEFLHSDASKRQLMGNMARDAPTHSNLMRPPISTISTPFVLLTNIFTMENKTPAFFEELKKDVLEMCSRFGVIEKIFVEKNNQGNVWLRFSDTQSAIKAQESLSAQYFDGKKIFCYFVMEHTYQARVGNN